jgi:hypothetical protein
MDPMGIKAVDEKGVFEKFGEAGSKGVTLREDAACAFVRIDAAGIAHCTIEEAWKAGATHFRKPISCHLYPIRIRKSEIGGYDAMNYDEWSVCSPACTHGKELQVPLYQFVREAIIRKYGQEFYDELDDVAQAMKGSETVRM